MVCLTTEYDDHQVVVAYYLTDDQLTTSIMRYALTDLAGAVIEKN